jgi:hypothetical protein
MQEVSGMTVNECLFVSGSMPAFDAAVARGDREAVREILRLLFLSDTDVDGTLNRVLPR